MNYIIYFILIILPIYQDSPIANKIGIFGVAPILIVNIILFLIFLIFKRKMVVTSFHKKLIYLEIYLVVINIISLTTFYLTTGTNALLGENIFLKSIKGNFYFIDIILYLILLHNLNRKLTLEKVLLPFTITYYLLFIILLIELNTKPFAFASLHRIIPYGRIRLLTSESSWTTMQIIVYSFMSFAYCYVTKKKKLLNISFFILIFFIFSSDSKGLMILYSLLLIYIYISYLISKNKVNLLKSNLIILVTFVFIYLTKDKLISLIVLDVQKYTSLATRMYSILITFFHNIHFPMGSGNALYLKYFVELLENNLNLLNNLNLNSNEIVFWLNSLNDQNISAKSAIFQYSLYWGIPGTILFIRILLELKTKALENMPKKDIKLKNYLKYTFVLVFILILLVNTFDYKYEFWSYISVLIYFSYKTK